MQEQMVTLYCQCARAMALNGIVWVLKSSKGEAVTAISFFSQPYLVDKIEMGASYFWQMGPEKSAVTGIEVLAQVEDDMQPVYHVAPGCLSGPNW